MNSRDSASSEITPAVLPDVYAGRPLVISGKYSRPGAATVKVATLSKPEYKGPKDPPQKMNYTFTLKRTDGNWTIQNLKFEQVK